MKVSIIIPAYNMERWIAETIESALAQTYSPKEILVIDDGSTDSTLSIAMRYDVFIVSTSNRGLASARNCGLMNTSGELVLPLDSDDRISPDFLAKTVPLMTPGVGIVSTDMQTFGLKSQLIRTEPATLRSEMTGANTIPVCSLVRRKCLLECGGWNARLTQYEDYCLCGYPPETRLVPRRRPRAPVPLPPTRELDVYGYDGEARSLLGFGEEVSP